LPAEPLRGFTDAAAGCPQKLSYGGFPGQLRFRRKEEFAGNALQTAVLSAAANLCVRKTPGGDGEHETGKREGRG